MRDTGFTFCLDKFFIEEKLKLIPILLFKLKRDEIVETRKNVKRGR